MEVLSKKDKEFYEGIIGKGYLTYHNGYVVFILNKKRYKRGRTLLQLHLNIKLSPYEIVHHKDGNKTNDCLDNLEIMSREEHNSYHHAGSKHKKSMKSTSKTKKEDKPIEENKTKTFV